jgi:shikimate dehydrogenase
VLQRFAVVGNPIDHSLSPLIHQYFAKQTNIHLTYQKIKADERSFEQQITDFFAQNGQGLNITLPFKQKAFAMAQHATERCKQAGAANTLWMHDQQLHADNTDGMGFIRDLNRYVALPGKRVLILGAGGAARGIIHPLLENKLTELVVANRTKAKAEEFQQAFPQVKCRSINGLSGLFDVVINATSASLAGEFVALPQDCLAENPFCYDLSYKQHADTAFVHYVKNLGCDAVDGLGMLVEQAAEAFYIWHGVMPMTQELLCLLRKE